MASFKRFIRSFKYALHGIIGMFRTQQNAWVHLLAACLALVLGFLYHISQHEWFMIIIVISLVFAAELFNTAIEMIVDKISPGRDPKMGFIKDLSAAAVLILAIAALLTGLIIFIPKIF